MVTGVGPSTVVGGDSEHRMNRLPWGVLLDGGCSEVGCLGVVRCAGGVDVRLLGGVYCGHVFYWREERNIFVSTACPEGC